MRHFVIKQEAHLRCTRDRYLVNWEEFAHCQVRANIKLTRRPSVSLVPETWMFLCMPSLLISGGPLLSLLCSASVLHYHYLLMGMVVWCASRLIRLICCQIILTASSPGSLLIFRSLAIHVVDLPPLTSGHVRSLLRFWPLWRYWPIVYVSSFS